jgi:hypothetical protein
MTNQNSNQEAGNVQAAFGHDSPVYYRTEDIYNRWPVATAISRAIASSPLSWSTRIGLFAPWGDGKTSALNLLEKQQVAINNIVIRFSPWGASTEDEIWRGFTKSLRGGLKKAREKLPLKYRAMYFFRRNSSWLSSGLSAAGKAANSKAPGISAGTDFAAGLIEKYIKPSRKDAQAMAEVLSERRVIVLIDDLDRTDPKVIPRLLLALRDLLDFSQFTFVLAFDHRVVAQAITNHNPAWQNPGDFLDKIIDFPFDLPAPTSQQVGRLARDQFSKLCPFVPTSALDTVISLIPANPRKLKLLGRVIASAKDEAKRHAPDEINWSIVIIFAMLRIECSQLATELLERSIDIESSDSEWLHWAMLERDEREAKTEAATTKLIEKHAQDHNEARLRLLIRAWRDAVPSISGEGLRYQAMFTITPQSITWGEFRPFFADWRKEKRKNLLAPFISQRAKSASQSEANVSYEFSDTIISYYATILERAAQVQSREEHLALMNEACDVVEMAHRVFVGKELTELDQDSLIQSWTRFRSIVLQWLHFNSNPGELELREKEALFLAEFASSLNKPLEVFDILKPWQEEDSIWGQRETELKRSFSKTIQDAVLDGACERALGILSSPGELKMVRSAENLALRYLLCSPDSPLFSDDRKHLLLTSLEGRREGAYAAEDSIDYLSTLLSAMQHGDPICRADARMVFIENHADFVALLWSLVISRPSQFRALSTLREQRSRLIAAGMNSDDLPTPEWLDTPRIQLADQ